MQKILLGKDPNGKPVQIDLKTFITTRGLIQAASGGGKSRTIRRLGEQFFGKVQTFIIDKEGEFPSLREKFGYVLVGKGGETPTDTRSAELVCHRLLEANASAVFDLYDLKIDERPRWVRLFLEALMNAPKSLWRPLVVIVDEAHRFAPEGGDKGKAESYGSMIDLAADGRKRGFCMVAATQRLAKFTKNASAELLNRLVGHTVEDLDVDRAVDLMGVRRADRENFEDSLKKMKPGTFWAFGPAISSDRCLVHVGGVLTTHPEPGTPAAGAPPPTPEKVKALLPKLADLPKQAEVEKKTLAEFKAEIRTVKFQLSEAQKALAAEKNRTTRAPAARAIPAPPPPPKLQIKQVDVPVVHGRDVKRLEAALSRAENLYEKLKLFGKPVEEAAKELNGAIGKVLSVDSSLILEAKTRKFHEAQRHDFARSTAAGPDHSRVPARAARPRSPMVIPPASTNGDSEEKTISRPQMRILGALAQFEAIGILEVRRQMLAGWMGLKVSGSFNNNLGALRTSTFIDYAEDRVKLTEAGRAIAPGVEEDITTEGLLRHCLDALSTPQGRMLAHLHGVHPEWITRQELAEKLGLQVSGSFNNNLGAMHTAGMVEYGSGSEKQNVKCADWLFQEVLSQSDSVGRMARVVR